MAISSTDYILFDEDSGNLFGADTTVIVPGVSGAAAYDILFNEETAIEYAEAQGEGLLMPGEPGIALEKLEQEDREYWGIDIDNGQVTLDASKLVLVSWEEDYETLDADERIEIAKRDGHSPVVAEDVLDLVGLPFESVLD